jgi:hypothetical protein
MIPGWWHISVILALQKLRKEDLELESRLGYIARLCLRNKLKKKKKPTNSWVMMARTCNPSYQANSS